MGVKVSIIVPVYNVEQYLDKCINSILNQTFRDFELILVDDGSTDNSGDICDKYKKIDNRITVIHKKNAGLSSARNTGLKYSKGEYIGFIDSDDYIDKDMYNKLYNVCKENNCDISVCKFGHEIDGKYIRTQEDQYVKIMNNHEGMEELFKGILYRFSSCNKLYKATVFKEITFPEGRIHEDLSTTYRLFSNANKIAYINYIGYIYVKRSNSILTSSYSNKRLDAFIGWSEILDFINEKYPMLKDTVYACYTYACIDHMYYISNQVSKERVQKSLLKVIQTHLKKHYRFILQNKILSIKYKILISILNYNISALILVNKFKRKVLS